MGRLPKSAEVRGRFWQARATGATLKEAAAAAGVSKSAGHYWLHESGGVRPRPTKPRPALRLSLAEREEISRGLAKRMTLTAIAVQIGRSPSTVSREVKRNRALTGYRAVKADRLAQARTARPRLPKLALQPELRAEVEKRLAERWSPQQISRRLAIDFPDDPLMAAVGAIMVMFGALAPARGYVSADMPDVPGRVERPDVIAITSTAVPCLARPDGQPTTVARGAASTGSVTWRWGPSSPFFLASSA